MRRIGDALIEAHLELIRSADHHAAQAIRVLSTVQGATTAGLAERYRATEQALRDKAAVCEALGQQCHATANSTVQLQHLLIVTGIVLGAQLSYDMLLFFQGGGMKALSDRVAAEAEMRAAARAFASEVAEQAAAGTARRAALHGALHAAKIGAGTGAVTSVAAQVWDIADNVRDGFDFVSFGELALGGLVGGIAGAEVGRRLAPSVLRGIGGRATSDLGRVVAHMGGTIVIGGAGGVAGGLAGAIPSVIIRHNEIHSLGDLFKIARTAAVTGFAGGFLGGATNSLRAGVHPRVDAVDSGRPPRHLDAEGLPGERPPHPESVPHDPTHDYTADPPTRPQPRIAPESNTHGSEHDPLPSPAAPGNTVFYRHPEGHVDVTLTGPDGARLPLRLIPGQEYVLGRGTGALLEHMATDGVSRSHGTIRVDDRGHVFLRDNGSLNGTFIDGKQIVANRWVRVFDGQGLKLGHEFDLGLNFQRQLAEVRLGADIPPVRVHRGGTVDVGREALPPDAAGRATVSREHLKLGMDQDGRVWIQDSNSSNGTRINGELLTPGEQHTLRPGDAVQLGGFRSEAQFIPADGAVEAPPVRFVLGSGPEAVPVRIEPGQTVPIGTDPSSPFAAQLGRASGVDPRHATLGLDRDGRVWIRDHDGSPGVWINGDRIAPGQKVTLAASDGIRIGSEFFGTARVDPIVPGNHQPAALNFLGHGRRDPIHLAPGQEKSINVSNLRGDAVVVRSDGVPINVYEVFVGRDHDGRVWIRDPKPDGWVGTKINGETIVSNEKIYLNPNDTIDFGGVPAKFRSGPETPVELRLFDNPDIPPLRLLPGEQIPIGRGSESPLAEHLTDTSVSRKHATVLRDLQGNLWIRDEHSTHGTWVENRRVDPDGGPVQIRPGDRIRLGEWIGSAQYAGDEFGAVGPGPTPVLLNNPHGGLSLEIPRGGEPTLLGRNDSRIPADLPNRNQISGRHASVGVHPSGRVWIRDEGSTNGTTVNGSKIKPGVQVTLQTGDAVSLGGTYDFTVSFPPPEGGPFVNMLDSLPESLTALKLLAQIPDHVFQHVSDYLNAMPDGGIVIGQMRVKDMPGLEALVKAQPDGPNDHVTWNNVAGLFTPGSRRLYIDTKYLSDAFKGGVLWHEFGHAADASYSIGGNRLSKQKEWLSLHADILQSIGNHPKWWDYANTPVEGFAEAFSAWVAGPKQLRKFACGDQRIARELEKYFERSFK
ncbi:FHA domain-containing protein [Nocardia sp. NPDC052001]|uniref:FHA domain-containing protein n=1 Tax=Nocardia sp. NPDC052001 TaxID=3154853 RepID=UPI00343437F5